MTKWRMTAAIALACMSTTTQAAKTGWTGHYVYEHDGGRTAGGSGIVVRYDLMLRDGSCRLRAAGFQTDETILCAVRGNSARIDILFRSYADGRTVNKYGTSIYLVGEPLLSLGRRADGIVTQWRRYSPEDEYPAPGRYFRFIGVR